MATAIGIATATAVATVMEGYGEYKEGKYQKKVADTNADILRQNAYRKRLETSINEDIKREQNRRQISKNMAAAVERGVGGSATTIGAIGQQMTDLEQNVLNFRYEGISAANNMDIQANSYKQQGKAYKRAGKNAFYMSLLKAPLNGAAAYYNAGGTGGING